MSIKRVPYGRSAGVKRGRAKARNRAAVTIYTVGYEKRTGAELMALLKEHGVEVLADIRQRPMSRKVDFRGGVLRASCDRAGIEYRGWPGLGSTEEQRDDLHETGDFPTFARRFRAHAVKHATSDLDELARGKAVALLCYERCHGECHRSVVADLLADRLRATVVPL